jgi:gamma-glutamylcyclotransferase (GGCT)/AIG2-like uncharacterized protein YtfP
MSTHPLFVYGTLLGSAGEISQLLERRALPMGEGKVRGRLFDLGSYPGMVLSQSNSHLVKGKLYMISAEHWDDVIKELDAYEGCAPNDPLPHEYRRELVDVTTSSGDRARAWAYVLNRSTAGLRPIPTGDYLAWRPRFPKRGAG